MNKDYILDQVMSSDDIEGTLRQYFHALLFQLWEEGEGFSGKRPFGNSGWEWDIYHTLVKCGAVEGTIDEYGEIEDFNKKAANSLVFSLINHIFFGEDDEN